MKTGREKMTRAAWYVAGGFKNSALFRKADKRGTWSYYRVTD